MGLRKKSLSVILGLVKKGKLSEEDAINLIEDLYDKSPITYWYPYYTTTWYNSNKNNDSITYTNQVTC